MSFFMNSISVPLRKNTANAPSVKMGNASVVTLPMQMHIGEPATPVVKMGDLVKVGTLVAKANGEFSSPIYASVSGKVTKIADYVTASGKTVPAVVITSDGEMACEEFSAPEVNDRDSLIEAIRNSGVVGLGGAGFPTSFKFDIDFSQLEVLIVNGTECEPFITSDDHTMRERGADIEYALKAYQTYFGIKRIIIGVGDNKPEAIKAMEEVSSHMLGSEVVAFPSTYSHGSEEAIIFHTLGKVLSADQHPIDLGCLVTNVTTVAAIGNYLKTGIPFVERLVTVDGGCVKNPQCVLAPLGVSLAELVEFCGGLEGEPEKVVVGGPMMGISVPSLDTPVLKTTSAVLALSEKQTRFPKETACIRCGKCTNNCPLGLAPAAIEKAYAKRDVEAIEKLMVNTCMECGSCAYLCPAHRPLVQTNKLAKMLLKEEKAKEENK